MARYFIELAYKGTAYSGFQVQENANTVQSEVEKAFAILHRQPVMFTGSSRTDAGVHALQNFFHFDFDAPVHPQFVYKMNAILPPDIVVKNIFQMPEEAHSRFDATSREYIYHIHRFKDPFLRPTSFFFPYKLDIDLMHEAAGMLLRHDNFFAFSKTNTQVRNFYCNVARSSLVEKGDSLTYTIEANRFLRGMVRSVTATLLKIGRHKLSLLELENFFAGEGKAGFSVPAHGLFLRKVNYPENYFPATVLPFTGF